MSICALRAPCLIYFRFLIWLYITLAFHRLHFCRYVDGCSKINKLLAYLQKIHVIFYVFLQICYGSKCKTFQIFKVFRFWQFKLNYIFHVFLGFNNTAIIELTFKNKAFSMSAQLSPLELYIWHRRLASRVNMEVSLISGPI